MKVGVSKKDGSMGDAWCQEIDGLDLAGSVPEDLVLIPQRV